MSQKKFTDLSIQCLVIAGDIQCYNTWHSTETEKVVKLNYDESDYHVIEFNVSAINQESKRVFSNMLSLFRQLIRTRENEIA